MYVLITVSHSCKHMFRHYYMKLNIKKDNFEDLTYDNAFNIIYPHSLATNNAGQNFSLKYETFTQNYRPFKEKFGQLIAIITAYIDPLKRSSISVSSKVSLYL